MTNKKNNLIFAIAQFKKDVMMESVMQTS